MRSYLVTLLLEKVSIVLGTPKFNQYDEEADDLVRLETKKQLLLTVLRLSYGTSLIGTIVEMCMHVMYEDDVTNPQQISTMGFTLESLVARICDEF
jgi:hypothetical protein